MSVSTIVLTCQTEIVISHEILTLIYIIYFTYSSSYSLIDKYFRTIQWVPKIYCMSIHHIYNDFER